MKQNDNTANRKAIFPVSQQGIALVVVLWVILLLSVMAASYASSTRVEAELAQHAVESSHARASAEAAVQLAVRELLIGRDSEIANWRADGSVYSEEFDGADLRIAIEDESAKVDLNDAYPELIGGIVRSTVSDAKTEKMVTDAILDWRDSDNISRPDGAEDSDYEKAGLPYGAKDASFDNLEELLLVMGVDKYLYKKLSRVVTIYSGSKGINPVWASRQVLLALPGVDQAAVDDYLQLREQSLASGLPLPPLAITDRRYLASEEGMVFTIHVEARTASGVVDRAAAVVMLITSSIGNQERPFDVLLWKDTDPYFEKYDSERETAGTQVSAR